MSLSSGCTALPGQGLSPVQLILRKKPRPAGVLSLRAPRLSMRSAVRVCAMTSWQPRMHVLMRHGIQTYDFGTRYLQQGCVGDDVAQLQQFLRSEGLMKGQDAYSGYFGPVTEKAVIKWQQQHDLPATGGFGDLARDTYLQKQELRLQHVLAAKQPQVEMTVESNQPLYEQQQATGVSLPQWIAFVMMGCAALLAMVQGWAWWKKSSTGQLFAAEGWLGDMSAIKQQLLQATSSFREATRPHAPPATSIPMSLPEPAGLPQATGLTAVHSPYGTYYKPADMGFPDEAVMYTRKTEAKVPPPPPPPAPLPQAQPARLERLERDLEYDELEAQRAQIAREYGIKEYTAARDSGSSRDSYGTASSGVGQSSSGRSGPTRVPSTRDTGSYFGGAVRRPSFAQAAAPSPPSRAVDVPEAWAPDGPPQSADDKSGWDAWTNLFQSPGQEGGMPPTSGAPPQAATSEAPKYPPAYGAGPPRELPGAPGGAGSGSGSGFGSFRGSQQQQEEDPAFWAFGTATERSAAYKQQEPLTRATAPAKPVAPVPSSGPPPAVPQTPSPVMPPVEPPLPRDTITPVELLPRHSYSTDELNAIKHRLTAKRPEGSKGGEIWINNMRVVPEGQPPQPTAAAWPDTTEPTTQPAEPAAKTPGTDYKLVTGNPPVIPSPSASALNGNAKQ